MKVRHKNMMTSFVMVFCMFCVFVFLIIQIIKSSKYLERMKPKLCFCLVLFPKALEVTSHNL